METLSALLPLCEGNHQSWLTGQCWCCIHKSLWLYWITRKLTSRIRLSTSEVTRASPGHYLENPYTGLWSPNCHGHGHEWPNPTPVVQCQSIPHSEIQLFQNLTMKNLGQGYACGQRSRSHLTLEIQRSKSWPKSNPLVTFETWISIDILITRVSEVIMFSPCVFVTLFFCLCLYHDVCPDDLTMKDWCHTNNILQVHCWGCLVVQVMFHALMTSSMTSSGHKVGQILKVIYLRQYLS